MKFSELRTFHSFLLYCKEGFRGILLVSEGEIVLSDPKRDIYVLILLLLDILVISPLAFGLKGLGLTSF